MLRAAGVGGDKGQVDFRFQGAGQLNFGALGGVAQPLQRHPVLGQVNAGFGAELGHQPVEDGVVKVVAAQESIAVGGQHLKDAVAQLQDGDVKSAAAQVKDGHGGIGLLLVNAVGQR